MEIQKSTNAVCKIEFKDFSCYFVYKGQDPEIRLTINLRVLIHYVDYFYENKDKYYEGCEIELLNKSQMPYLNMQIIQDFYSYCQNKEIIINNSNVIQLKLLSDQFNIISLQKQTLEYINLHNSELILPKLLSNKDDINEDDEQIISNNLFHYIENDQFHNLPVPILNRILQQYNNKSKHQSVASDICQNDINLTKEEKERKIRDFLFKCLDFHKGKASSLFSIFDFICKDKEVIIEILQKYSDIFNFSFLASPLAKTLCEVYVSTTQIPITKEMPIETNEDKNKILEIPEGTTHIDDSKYLGYGYEVIKIPKTVISIGKLAFAHNSNLRKVIIDEGSQLKIIDDQAFMCCDMLETINLNCPLIKIGRFAFKNCKSLIHIDIPNTLTEIDQASFNFCSSLQKIKIPSSVKIIKNEAFWACISVKEIEIPDSVIDFGFLSLPEQCKRIKRIKSF